MIAIKFEKDRLWNTPHLPIAGKNLYNAQQFAFWLKDYSCADITKVSATQIKTYQGGNTTEGKYGSVSLVAMVHLKSEENGHIYGVPVPAPVESVFDTNQKVLPEFGIAVAEKYSILAGVQFTFTDGALWGT